MKLIKIEEARPGLRVARDVSDLRGSRLVPSGTVLTLEMLDQMRSRHVSHLFIEEEAAAPGVSPAGPPAPKEADVAAELDEVFAQVASNPLMAQLRDAAQRYLLGRGE